MKPVGLPSEASEIKKYKRVLQYTRRQSNAARRGLVSCIGENEGTLGRENAAELYLLAYCENEGDGSHAWF